MLVRWMLGSESVVRVMWGCCWWGRAKSEISRWEIQLGFRLEYKLDFGLGIRSGNQK